MHISKIILVLLTIGALALVPTIATAQTTRTFDVTSGVWDTPGNWDPSGKPVAGDTAIILDGQTCKVEDDHQAVKILDLRSGGTLEINGKRLTLGEDDSSTTSAVSGQISFTKVSGFVGRIVLEGTVTVNGSGTIGKRGVSYEGRLGPIGGFEGPLLKLAANIDLQGELEIRPNLELNSTLTIDSSDDLITVGHTQVMNLNSTELSGTGKFSVTGGELRFRITAFDATSTPA